MASPYKHIHVIINPASGTGQPTGILPGGNGSAPRISPTPIDRLLSTGRKPPTH